MKFLSIKKAAEKILSGNLVVFPTETVYGIGADIFHEKAVKKIFEVKGRPEKNPLIIHIADKKQLAHLVKKIPEKAKKLIGAFWPGPLTLCFKKKKSVSDLVTAGLKTVCIRMPNLPLAQQFLKTVGVPVAAPSANISGKPSTTNLKDAKKQLSQKGVYFLKGEDSPLGLESTVVDVSGKKITILRPGMISKKALEKVLKEKIENYSSKNIKSPGQLLSHYAPQGKLNILFGEKKLRRKWLQDETFSAQKKYALGIVGKLKEQFPLKIFVLAHHEKDERTYSKNLYRFLNWCDKRGAAEIILELPLFQGGLSEALSNRLKKASGGRIIELL